ncbi:SGNH/GDSL hydrolase family protein [Methylovirgula sp. 4M-Z18]|uniref:SGNH/GDSL hydrolase family protein n=1 Tax=Methylovirgula sp. 4M-Z18 TaxID=2293567 RepID=UPI000E2E4BA3|nr:GDSL-type esterase/lipase family protein [Methylovirgula sp. 4M-Z18]
MTTLDTLHDSQTVAFLGASNATGTGPAFDWVGELQRRPRNRQRTFRHFGAGGELAANVLQHVPEVVAAKPDKIVIFLGGNEILAGLSDKARRFFTSPAQGTEAPSAEGFQENLNGLVSRLKNETGARIALCSLPPLGEARGTEEPFQRLLNEKVEQYSARIAHTAFGAGCAYVPLYEAFLVHLNAAPVHALTGLRLLPFFVDAFRSTVLRQDPDAIGERNGWHFHIDGIHLNRRGGLIAADLVQKFLDA